MIQPVNRRTSLRLLLGAAIVMAAPVADAAPAGAPDPESSEFAVWVMNYIDDLHRGDRSQGILEMRVETRHFERAMAMESWSLGKDYSLVRILAPKKERGTATLKARDDLFTYLSKTGRTIKITGGMMGASWMGSHFTNDDLVRSTRLAEDYEIEKTYSGPHEGIEIHRFDLTPKPDAPVVWGKIVISVRSSDLQPLHQTFFDEDGRPVRLLDFSEYRQVGDRMMPTKMVMRPLDKPDEHTIIRWKKIDFGVDLDPSFFSLQRLRSM